jgi:hypothetical protein
MLSGPDGVFMDVEDIRPGQNFAQTIDHWIEDCNTVLVVVGPKWLDCLQQRLKQNEPDYVAHEIAEALARKINVIPVLVGGAHVDELTNLPPALAELAFHQAVELRDSTFREDCDRLAQNLGLRQTAFEPAPAQPGNNARYWAGGLAALMLLLLAANWAGFGPWQAYRERSAHIQQLLRTAQVQTNLSEHESAFKTYQEVLHLDGANRSAMNLQVDAAIRWAEEFHVLVGENQKAEDLAGPPLREILSVLEAGLARTNGHDSRAADILAHIGWTHWLNEHIAYKEFGQAAEQGMRQALSVDPTNVYANAMLGNWLLQKNQDFNEALQHFETALKTGKQRLLVRQMQLGGLFSSDDARTHAELAKAANQMRLNQEPLTDRDREQLLRIYTTSGGFRNGELERTLSAVPSSEAWATFLWLDNKPAGSSDSESRNYLREIVRAYLAGLDGKREQALAQFKTLQNELKQKQHSGSLAQEVDLFVQRFSKD